MLGKLSPPLCALVALLDACKEALNYVCTWKNLKKKKKKSLFLIFILSTQMLQDT